MTRIFLFVIVICLLYCLAYGESDYCRDFSLLSTKINQIYDKKELLETTKACFENLRDSKEYIILLTKLYILNENHYYARKILIEYYLNNRDCEIAGYIAYTDFILGDTEALKESLHLCNNENPDSGELKSRLKIIRSLAEKTSEPPAEGAIYPEDLRLYLLQEDREKTDIKYNIRAKTGLGYTTNAFSSNPLDTGPISEKESFLLDYDFGIGISKGFQNRFNFGIDSGIKGIKFFSREENFSPDNLSSYTILFSPNLEYKAKKFHLTLKYRFDTLFLNTDTEYQRAPTQFFEGHRAEAYLNLSHNFSLFAGTGRRYFDELARSRNEYDAGFGYYKTFSKDFHTLLLLTNRYYDANSEGYDDLGHSLLIRLEYKTPLRTEINNTLTLGFDNYINSTGYFTNARKREDTLIRYNAEVLFYIF
ncbi:MAG: hypothetical protein N3B13_06800, partial [Deltaproteobacteria bacterium]|nr:hypothetical protein [Deltaproteobacteria bacterium]